MPVASAPFPDGSLVLLVGPPGSGKSTLAAALAAAGLVAPEDVLSSDRYRARLTGDPADTSADRRMWVLLRLLLVERMAEGRTTVLDATNLYPRRRARHIRVAKAHGRPVVVVRLEVPLDQLLARNRGRRRVVPAGVVRDLAGEMAGLVDDAALVAEGIDHIIEAADLLDQPAIRLASAAISSMPPSMTTDVPVM